MTETVKTIAVADALGVSRKSVLERAEKEHWAYSGKGNTKHWIERKLPADVRFALLAKSAKDIAPQKKETCDVKKEDFSKASDKAKQTAVWRCAVLFKYRESGLKAQVFVEEFNSGAVDRTLLAKFGEVSAATLYRWLKDFNKHGADGLIPKYGMNSGGAGASLTDIEKDYLRHFWLKETQPSAMHALRQMKANVPYSRCSYSTANNYLKQIPVCIADYYRKGAGRFENAYLPYMEQDVERYRCLDRVVSDHHVLDCVCRDGDKLIRPWITTIQDYRSGKILGWCVCRKPSSLSIIVAYYMVCIMYGVPRELLFDNGKDYHSQLLNGRFAHIKAFTPEGIEEEQEVYFEGVFGIIGSAVRFTRVYNGKSKGRQERYFRMLGEYLAKDFGSYIGSDSRTRPEDAILMWRGINGLSKRDDVKDFKEFVEAASDMVRYINDFFECSGKGMNGMTRSQVFEKYLPPADEIRHVSKETLQSALVTGEVRKCGRNGVKVHGINFYHPDLIRVVNTQVIVKVSLVFEDEVQVYDSAGRFICTAYADVFKESGNLKEDVARLESARKRSLEWIAEQGTNEVQASPEYRTMLDVASSVYANNSLPGVDEALGLPKAAGAEADDIPQVADDGKSAKNTLKDPYDYTDKDWI